MTFSLLREMALAHCHTVPGCTELLACHYEPGPPSGYRVVCDAGHANGFHPDEWPQRRPPIEVPARGTDGAA